MHTPAHPPRHGVAILAYDGLCTFEFGIAVEVFGLPRPEFDFPWYDATIVAVDAGPMRALGGISVTAQRSLEALADPAIDTLIIPGWRSREAPPPAALLDALRAAHGRGVRIVSICSGVFVLASSGLLDGKAATTHWRYTDEMARRFPAVGFDPNVLFVDAGSLISSAGSAAGIDACLHLVTRDYGAQVANTVARRLVAAPQRSGGQAQFIPAPVSQTRNGNLSPLLQWVREHLHRPLGIAELAQRVAMSERTFLRRFQEATGMTPKAWLQHERILRARELLEAGQSNSEFIAQACGFGSVESFRVAFRTLTGVPPSVYRERFGQRAVSALGH